MLVFFFILILIFSLIYLTKLQINVDNLEISNYDKKINNSQIIVYIYILKLKIFSKKINYHKLKTITKNTKIKRFSVSKIHNKINSLKQQFATIKDVSLIVNIGIGDVLATTYMVTIISTILACFATYYAKKIEKYYYVVAPIYDDELKYRIILNGIIEIKTVHIIHIIYHILKKGRSEKYGRASNRRTYERGYE